MKYPKILPYLILLMAFPLFSQSAYHNLIHENDLDNWETQGGGNWRVSDGVIEGWTDDTYQDWGHLVTKQEFSDATITFQYNQVEGDDSGIYLRSHIRGIFGVTGVQVELGIYDGWPLIVEEESYTWVGGGPVDSGFAPRGQWNDARIEMAGREFSVYLNGKHVITHEVADTSLMPVSGRLALQLHDGSRVTSVFYRNLEVFTPLKISGCTDSQYSEYDAQANHSDSTACRTLGISRSLPGEISGRIITLAHLKSLIHQGNNFPKIYGIKGRRIDNNNLENRKFDTGIYLISGENGDLKRVFVVP